MNKKWECYATDEKLVEKIVSKYNVSRVLAKILINRNVQDIDLFLNPTRNDFHDPYLMPDMELAVDRILKAIDNKEKVIVYGDYDVDGITSITVLKKFLKERGLEVDYYIPNRLDEGYGLNKNAIDKIVNNKYQLMITVDCGISANDEVEYAIKSGIEVIVTDHHEPLESLPKAIAVVDAKRKDNKYPFNQLAGVGVVFKLIQAIGIKLNLEEKEYLKFLDIVCVGTISDIVPLVDENRVISKLGLKLVERTKNVGLATILEVAGYKKIDSFSISFGVAPRINACGRMGVEQEAIKLFFTENKEEAKEIAEKLDCYNKSRQETEREILKEVLEKAEKEKEKSCIVLGNDNWHHGVIGIVASKVTDLYYKPSILICFEGEEGKGSGRSIQGFDLHDAISRCSENVEKFGGHSMAIGISLKRNQFDSFKNEFEKYVDESNIKDIVPIIKIDEEITLKDVNLNSIKGLSLLEPFGEANKMPMFMIKKLKIDSIRALTQGKHLKLTLKDEKCIIEAVGFNMGELSEVFQIGDKVDVVGYLEVNRFGERENVQINLKDVRKSY